MIHFQTIPFFFKQSTSTVIEPDKAIFCLKISSQIDIRVNKVNSDDALSKGARDIA